MLLTRTDLFWILFDTYRVTQKLRFTKIRTHRHESGWIFWCDVETIIFNLFSITSQIAFITVILIYKYLLCINVIYQSKCSEFYLFTEVIEYKTICLIDDYAKRFIYSIHAGPLTTYLTAVMHTELPQVVYRSAVQIILLLNILHFMDVVRQYLKYQVE